MSTSPCPVMWDFTRIASEEANGVAGIAHYYDETGQTIYIGNGLATNTTEAPQGHWREAEFSEQVIIDEQNYTNVGIDQPCTGLLYGVAVIDHKLTFWRYLYAMEMSSIVKDGTLCMEADNPVIQTNVTLMNVDNEQLESEAGLYLPGSKLRVGLYIGESSRIPMGIHYVDDVDYSIISDTVTLSARNSIGFLLRDQTLGDDIVWEGPSSEIIEELLVYAGITKYMVQPIAAEPGFTFEYNTTVMDAIEKICEYHKPFKLIELPDGTVLVGRPAWVNSYQATGYSQFSFSELWKRQTKRVADGAYTAVRATGKLDEGTPLEPVAVPVTNWTYWSLPKHKIYHVDANSFLTQEELATYAESVAEELQFVGINDSFSVPMRPQLLPGDVAQLYKTDDEEAVSLGLVTSLTHHFGKSGYYTDFVVDSGGKATDGASRSVISATRNVFGHNRKQTMADLIAIVAKKY